jgi:DNA (cytosine-5)-methyltransferase 1
VAKILNLYAGIGGNRKLWGNDHDITAVEIDETIAAIYRTFYPNDTVIVGDAHQYLLEHFTEYDFIWASPPCPTHSKMNRTNYYQFGILEYPSMTLYQEIILLQNWFKGKYCVENVIAYYEPLITPIKSGGHYYWTNFNIKMLDVTRGIGGKGVGRVGKRAVKLNIDLSEFKLTHKMFEKVINNCVEPETGLHILSRALNIKEQENVLQPQLF